MERRASNTAPQTIPGTVYVAVFAVAVPLAYYTLGRALDLVFGNLFFQGSPGLTVAGIALSLAGLSCMTASTILLRRIGHGLPISSSPPGNLVTSGPYRWSRHPIYLGASATFLGIALLSGSFWSAVLATPLLGFFYFAYGAGIEEPILTARHGDEYRAYQARTALVMGFPLRKRLVRFISSLLDLLSSVINRPGISQSGSHLLFWGYGIWLGIGSMLALTLSEFLMIALGFPGSKTAWMIVAITATCLAGSHLMWSTGVSILERVSFKNTIGRVGFSSWGVLTGLLLVLPVLAWIMGESPILVLDAALPPLMIAHVFGRIGCAFYGCCYGSATETPLRISYTHPALKAVRERTLDPASLRPVQLISALNGCLAATVVYGVWYVLPLPPGIPLVVCIVLYGFLRLGEEWLRAQRVRLWGLVSPHQIVAISLICAGMAYLVLGSGTGGMAPYPSLREIAVAEMFRQMHPVLLLTSGAVTGFVFSYHQGEIGQWK